MDDKDQEIWEKIFNNDPDGILDIKLKKSNTRTADERLLSSFEEINDFFIINNREPTQNIEDVSEFQLYSRLKSLREDKTKVENIRIVSESAKELARFHKNLNNFQSYNLYNTIPGFHNTRVIFKKFQDVLLNTSKHLLDQCIEQINYVLSKEKDCNIIQKLVRSISFI